MMSHLHKTIRATGNSCGPACVLRFNWLFPHDVWPGFAMPPRREKLETDEAKQWIEAGEKRSHSWLASSSHSSQHPPAYSCVEKMGFGKFFVLFSVGLMCVEGFMVFQAVAGECS